MATWPDDKFSQGHLGERRPAKTKAKQQLGEVPAEETGEGALNVNKQKHNNMPPWFMMWPLSLKLLTRVLATTISALFIASAPRLTNNKMKTMWLAGQYGSSVI